MGDPLLWIRRKDQRKFWLEEVHVSELLSHYLQKSDMKIAGGHKKEQLEEDVLLRVVRLADPLVILHVAGLFQQEARGLLQACWNCYGVCGGALWRSSSYGNQGKN